MFLIIDNEVLNEKELYEQFLHGSIEAFESLVLANKDKLILFIQRFVQNITIAEDLAQDVFVEIYVNKERYNFGVSLKTYLFTIGRNKAVDYIRKNNRVLLVDEYPDMIKEEISLEEKVIKREEKRMLFEAMKKLKEDYQAAITLIDFEDMAYAEAAKVLNKSEGQMKILIHRARKSLAKELKREGFLHEK